MPQFLPLLSTLFDLLLVVVGFGLIIVIHELGHFVAARWAGIRVFAFAVGFGPAVFSYRKGLGLRRGSSEPTYRAMLADRGLTVHDEAPPDVSPTEYRLNWLPFGGYVKMLGQEDANPGAVSHAPDSYQTCHPAKRLVVISAGVVANVVLAAFIFMFVFMVGLKTEPPRLGIVVTNGPAAAAEPEDPSIVPAGLESGDTVLRVNDREARSFNDLMLATAMATPGKPIDVLVQRDGFDEPLRFEVLPRKNDLTNLQDIGVAPARSTQLFDDGGDRDSYDRVMRQIGLEGVQPGATLATVAIDGRGSESIEDSGKLADVFAESNGRAVTLEFQQDGTSHRATLEPRPVYQEAMVAMPSGARSPQMHLLGLTPVMTVTELDPSARGYEQGLRTGDLFARLGSVEYPSITAGIAEIKRRAGESIPIVVIRDGAPVEFIASVKRDGTIGFFPSQDLDSPRVSLPPVGVETSPGAIDRPGLEIVSVEGRPVMSFAEIRAALIDATSAALASGSGAEVGVVVRLPDAEGTVIPRTLSLTSEQVDELHALGFGPPPGLLSVFRPAEFTLKAEGPIDAIGVGLAETHRVMMMTYLTFARLVQGSVKVEHLKGPVGIAHLGTRIADRGIIWLLFFMALISVNLAVVNFLPIPIVDGGQFLFILFEWARGKPVPEAIQSFATVVGLLLIGAAFLLVTFNDIRNVFTGL